MREEKKPKRSKEKSKVATTHLTPSTGTSTGATARIFEVNAREEVVCTTERRNVKEEVVRIEEPPFCPVIRIEIPSTFNENASVKNNKKEGQGNGEKGIKVKVTEVDPEFEVTDFSTVSKGDENEIVPDYEEEEVEEKPLSKWAKYRKKYRPKWESDPKLKGWMHPHPETVDRVICSYCSCEIRAHKADLYKHCSTKKHIKNSAKEGNDSSWQYVGEDKDECNTTSFSPVIKKKGFMCNKKKTVKQADGSCLVIDSGIGEGECIIMNCLDNDFPMEPMDSCVINEKELLDASNRIGGMLIKDIENILRKESNVLKLLKQSGGNSIFSERNLQKLAKICIGHLSQQYLTESVMDTLRTSKSPIGTAPANISSKLESIEERMERTVMEVKNLKMCLADDVGITIGSFHHHFDGCQCSTPNSTHN